MRKRRFGAAVSGLLCALCIILVLAFTASVIFLLYGVSRSDRENGLSLFGYTVFLNDSSTPLDPYPPGEAVLVKDVPHESLSRGDRIICRTLDVNNEYYPAIRSVFLFSKDAPSTVLVRSFTENELIEVNRDDILGKCVSSSKVLGTVLKTIQDPDRRLSVFGLLFGGLLALFFISLIGYLSLSGRRKKKRKLSGDETLKIDDLIEEESVALVSESKEPPQDNTEE